MCVIVSMEKKIPSLEDFKLFEDKNKDGGGISWVDGGVLKFKKGIGYKGIYDIAKTYGTPCVAHFRISTVGGSPKSLCHPFIVSKHSPLDLKGEAKSLLYHNGHWTSWEKRCIDMVLNKNAVFPGGDWSDSRAMAWLAGNSNKSFFALIGQKVLIHTATTRTYYGAWEEKDGVNYSNLNWENKIYHPFDNKQYWRVNGSGGYCYGIDAKNKPLIKPPLNGDKRECHDSLLQMEDRCEEWGG